MSDATDETLEEILESLRLEHLEAMARRRQSDGGARPSDGRAGLLASEPQAGDPRGP